MAHQQAKRKINQNDLRRLMKERKENLTCCEKNIESPLAKYDSAGRLSCIACNEIIAVATLWRQHILSKTHKKNVTERLKRKNAEPDTSIPKKEKLSLHSETPTHPKPSINVDQHHNNNVNRLGASSSTKAEGGVVQEYSSSEDEEEDHKEVQNQLKASTQKTDTPNGLPSDFFDTPEPTNRNLPPPPSMTNSSKNAIKQEVNNTQEALPEGFFDDPILDAHARNVEYKDPMDEEWEKFKKTMAEETNVSQSIMEEDVQQSVAERDLNQIDEQMYYYSRVVAVQKKTEEIKVSAFKDNLSQNDSEPMEIAQGSGSEDDEQLLEELLDWRAKKMW